MEAALQTTPRPAASEPIPDFAAVTLNPEQQELKQLLNRQIPELCTELPPAISSSAILYVTRYVAGGGLERFVNLFDKYYAPAWTPLYYLYHEIPDRSDLLEPALKAQALAMFLHLFDDHLVDGELPLDHVALQLRTVAFDRFTRHTNTVAARVRGGERIAAELLDEYFTGVTAPPSASLDEYTANFRQQMATWTIQPYLAALPRGTEFAHHLRAAYEAFGIAWRFLDDLRDAREDAASGERTAVYLALIADGREAWDRGDMDEVAHAMKRDDTRGRMLALIHEYMERAASTAREIGLEELAYEFETMVGNLSFE